MKTLQEKTQNTNCQLGFILPKNTTQYEQGAWGMKKGIEKGGHIFKSTRKTKLYITH